MSKKPNFPEVLYVRIERDGEDTYYCPTETVEEVSDDAVEVAIYELHAVKRLVVTRELK